MIDQPSQLSSRQSTFTRGLAVQANVVGALIMRELHTRYGRDNIGYLWMVVDPMLLACAVALTRAASSNAGRTGDVRPVPFVICGYCTFILFRAVVGRSEGTLESNGPMLFHRMVTIFDMLFARVVLDAAGTGLTLAILLGFCAAFGFGSPPARPLVLMAGYMAMAWFAFAVSMIICTITNENRTAGRLVHPVMYMMMPLSGAFYELAWLPQPFRGWMTWFPLAQIFEVVRYGEFHSATSEYINPTYLIGSFMALTWIGLVSIKSVRRRVLLH